MGMALALNNLQRVDMPLNKEIKPNHQKDYLHYLCLKTHMTYATDIINVRYLFIWNHLRSESIETEIFKFEKLFYTV